MHDTTLAFDIPIISPILSWLGGEASDALADVWKSAMTALWSAGWWVMKLAFRLIDAFTTPDLSARGPMSAVLPTTLWIGVTVAGLMLLVQITVALIRRDGQSLGRVLIGIAQFGLVWVGYLGVASGLVVATDGLTKGLLEALLNVHQFSQVDLSAGVVIKSAVVATALGVASLFLLIPASFFYVIVMLVREAAIILLVATAPISAGGLLADTSKVWFWKTLRWFIASLLIAPVMALVLGVGFKLAVGVVSSSGDIDSAMTGMAVVSCVLVAIGAVCPLILFRLLAFVDPGTASGAALRQSWADSGGLSGVLSGGHGAGATSAATREDGGGRAQGEAAAEGQTQSRLSTALGAFGTGVQVVTRIGTKAADLGSDVLVGAGVGHAGYAMTPTDERLQTRHRVQPASSATSDGDDAGRAPADRTTPTEPVEQTPPGLNGHPPAPPVLGAGAEGAAGEAGAAGAASGAAAL
ncbi:MAG: hypothetical protein EPN43_10855 [Jatrophihabitans sp.]|nr:MAG: hypothetical protein EPN43_10855 [Jatrophihabitans sp.]